MKSNFKLFTFFVFTLLVIPFYLTIAQNANNKDDVIITKVEIYKANIMLKTPYAIAAGTISTAEAVFIKIFTNTNIYGVGESNPLTVLQGETQETNISMAKLFAKTIMGKDPRAIERRLQEINAITPLHNGIKSAFDMALYDIASKLAGMPLYRFLGGNNDKYIYPGATVYLDTPEIMADKALREVKRGFTTIKVKLGAAENDIERIKAIREKIGYEVPIYVDANQGWNESEAIKILRGIEKYNIEYAEQPLPKDDIDGMARVTLNSPIPIMADESVFDHRDAMRCTKHNACNFINIKLSKSGGIYNALKIAAIAESSDMICQVGCMSETRLGLTALVHFALANKMIQRYDIDSDLLFKDDPTIGGIKRGNDLSWEIPEANGLGADIDEEFLKSAEKFVVE
ncbi:MAG TPA: dipeptide epimerase [Bacteroidales bacterium]|nr:dipeptide epimerase [Bacteroidales bacterium]